MVGMKKNNELLEHLGIVNLETQTAPVICEVSGKDWIEYGTKDYRNLYPQFLIDLYYNSSTHAAICNQTSAMISGTGITIEDETNLDALVRLKKFINSANSKETLQEVMDKIAFDLKVQGAYALNVIWSKDRQTISEKTTMIQKEVLEIKEKQSQGKKDKVQENKDTKQIKKVKK